MMGTTRKEVLKAAHAMGMPESGVEIWVEEFFCFQKYMRVDIHIRTAAPVRSARIVKPESAFVLTLQEKGGLLRGTGDFLTDGSRDAHAAVIELTMTSGEVHRFENAVNQQNSQRDDFFKLDVTVREHIMPKLGDFDVLEVGARDRNNTHSTWGALPGQSKSYLGMDIIDGLNVDVVGDAHLLSTLLAGRKFDFVYSQFVFEHLAMPWVVAAEINRVMKPGGMAYMISNQSIGMHDLPWDFFRFSDSAWKALFNQGTGFEILGVALGDPVRLSPLRYHQGFADHEGGAGFQASSVFVRKIGETDLHWPIEPQLIYDQLSRMYPKEIED